MRNCSARILLKFTKTHTTMTHVLNYISCSTWKIQQVGNYTNTRPNKPWKTGKLIYMLAHGLHMPRNTECGFHKAEIPHGRLSWNAPHLWFSNVILWRQTPNQNNNCFLSAQRPTSWWNQGTTPQQPGLWMAPTLNQNTMIRKVQFLKQFLL